MQSIGAIIPKTVKRAGIDDKVISSRVVFLFEKNKNIFLDPVYYPKVQAVYFKSGVLNIASLSTRASQDLVDKAEEVVDRLNNLIGQKIVREIKVIV